MLLEPGSLLVIRDEAYELYVHRIDHAEVPHLVRSALCALTMTLNPKVDVTRPRSLFGELKCS